VIDVCYTNFSTLSKQMKMNVFYSLFRTSLRFLNVVFKQDLFFNCTLIKNAFFQRRNFNFIYHSQIRLIHILKLNSNQTNPKLIKSSYSSKSHQSTKESITKRNKVVAMYSLATLFGLVGLSYAAVPLYRLFCQVTGLGGTVKTGPSSFTSGKHNMN
jgi:hypothetical protein